jgi:hypothetical protein
MLRNGKVKANIVFMSKSMSNKAVRKTAISPAACGNVGKVIDA